MSGRSVLAPVSEFLVEINVAESCGAYLIFSVGSVEVVEANRSIGQAMFSMPSA